MDGTHFGTHAVDGALALSTAPTGATAEPASAALVAPVLAPPAAAAIECGHRRARFEVYCRAMHRLADELGARAETGSSDERRCESLVLLVDAGSRTVPIRSRYDRELGHTAVLEIEVASSRAAACPFELKGEESVLAWLRHMVSKLLEAGARQERLSTALRS